MKNRELKKAVESMDQISRTLKKMPTPPIIPVGIMGTIDGGIGSVDGKKLGNRFGRHLSGNTGTQGLARGRVRQGNERRPIIQQSDNPTCSINEQTAS
jgi:hypothetical protein